MNKQKTKINKIIKEHIEEVLVKVKAGSTITGAVKELISKDQYNDSVRRQFSKAVNTILKTDNSKFTKLEDSEEYREAQKREVKQSKYYIVTCAQSETNIHEKFWNNILAYSEHIGAEIIVQPSRYKSPTSLEKSRQIENQEKNKLLWDRRLQNHLYAKDIDLNNNLTFLGSLKIQPTAVNPLSGIQGFTGVKSSIVPHPKVHLDSLPVLDSYPHKLMMTTGSVTLPNYTDTKAGKRGEWEHEFGFVIVEIVSDEKFHVRQVLASKKTGEFYDLWNKVSNGKVTEYDKVPAIVFGDSHFGQDDWTSHDLAIGIAHVLKAENIILHDVFNGKSINHHELNNPIVQLINEADGELGLKEEIDTMLKSIINIAKRLPNTNVHIIQSNHDLFLEKWLQKVDWRQSSEKYLYIALMETLRSEESSRDGLIKFLIDRNVGYNNVFTHTIEESLRVLDVELGFHGHSSGNGARGSLTGFRNLNTKTITAHQHTPKRQGGAVIAGTLTELRMGYNKGASSWMQGIVILYPNGKASHVHFIDYKYTTLK